MALRPLFYSGCQKFVSITYHCEEFGDGAISREPYRLLRFARNDA
jgi:hypothetical protein